MVNSFRYPIFFQRNEKSLNCLGVNVIVSHSVCFLRSCDELRLAEGRVAGSRGFGVRGEGHTHTHSLTIRYYWTQSTHSALSVLNVVIVSPIKRGGVFTPPTIHTQT